MIPIFGILPFFEGPAVAGGIYARFPPATNTMDFRFSTLRFNGTFLKSLSKNRHFRLAPFWSFFIFEGPSVVVGSLSDSPQYIYVWFREIKVNFLSIAKD